MMRIFKAQIADIPKIETLQQQAVEWLTRIGESQWQTNRLRRTSSDDERSLSASVRRGEVFVMVDRFNKLVGTVTIDGFADPEFWNENDNPNEAVYIHRMVTDRNHQGEHLGTKLIEFAEEQAVRLGKEYLRLDAWKTNAKLHHYYESNGFQLIRIVDLPHRGSGALFQRRIKSHS